MKNKTPKNGCIIKDGSQNETIDQMVSYDPSYKSYNVTFMHDGIKKNALMMVPK